MKHNGKRFHTTGNFHLIVELFRESLASSRLVIKWNLYYDHFLFLMHIQELRCGFVLINMWCPTCRLPCIHWFVHEFASKFFLVEIELNIVVHDLVILFIISGYITLYPVIPIWIVLRSLLLLLSLQLASTEEYIDGQLTGNLGEILIR